MKNLTIAEAVQNPDYVDGLVLRGCGGTLQEWVDGVTGILNEENILKGTATELWQEPVLFNPRPEFNDIFLPFKKGVDYNLGKLAIWRINFGDCMWYSDYKDKVNPDAINNSK